MDAATATGKRKRPASDVTDAAAAAPAAAAADEASDAEVEEFYAILRRMRDASRHLCGAGARPAPRAPAWWPSFSWEDFATPAPAPRAATLPAPPDDEPVPSPAPPPRAAGLDLNAEPEPEAPPTPRSARIPA